MKTGTVPIASPTTFSSSSCREGGKLCAVIWILRPQEGSKSLAIVSFLKLV